MVVEHPALCCSIVSSLWVNDANLAIVSYKILQFNQIYMDSWNALKILKFGVYVISYKYLI